MIGDLKKYARLTCGRIPLDSRLQTAWRRANTVGTGFTEDRHNIGRPEGIETGKKVYGLRKKARAGVYNRKGMLSGGRRSRWNRYACSTLPSFHRTERGHQLEGSKRQVSQRYCLLLQNTRNMEIACRAHDEYFCTLFHIILVLLLFFHF